MASLLVVIIKQMCSLAEVSRLHRDDRHIELWQLLPENGRWPFDGVLGCAVDGQTGVAVQASNAAHIDDATCRKTKYFKKIKKIKKLGVRINKCKCQVLRIFDINKLFKDTLQFLKLASHITESLFWFRHFAFMFVWKLNFCFGPDNCFVTLFVPVLSISVCI